MTLDDFINELTKLKNQTRGNAELPVVLTDWLDKYNDPQEDVAEKICIKYDCYYPNDRSDKIQKNYAVFIGGEA